MITRRTTEFVALLLLNGLVVVLVTSWDGLPGVDRLLSRLGASVVGFVIASIAARALAALIHRGRDRTV